MKTTTIRIDLYVAFSIHGTNAFVSAKLVIEDTVFDSEPRPAHLYPKVVEKLKELEKIGMTRAQSRRPDFKSTHEIKLHWDKLLTKDGHPLRSPALILKRFNELAEMGWFVDKAAFIERHYKRR